MALCEKQDGTYEYVPTGEPICGEDFCDDCGECLACYPDGWEGHSHTWVKYQGAEGNPFNKNNEINHEQN